MPRPRIVFINRKTEQATGTGGTVADDKLPSFGRLKQLKVGVRTVLLAANAPPCRVALGLFPKNRRLGATTLKAGWARGASSFPDADAVSWDGDIPLGEDPELNVGGRNDTAGSVIYQIEATIETEEET